MRALDDIGFFFVYLRVFLLMLFVCFFVISGFVSCCFFISFYCFLKIGGVLVCDFGGDWLMALGCFGE